MNENKVIKERITKLRAKMQAHNIDWYVIPTADFHNSEYVNNYFKVREFFSGFTGSNGTLLISRETAGLWTDGRYFIQAEQELAGTGITLFRMMEEGVSTIQEFLQEHVQAGQQVGFDGRVMTAKVGQELEEVMKEKDVSIQYHIEIVDPIWAGRPKLPANPIIVLEDRMSGEEVSKKIRKIRKEMEAKKAECHILSKLDDIMWLFNIRGSDIACNPVALSYAMIDKKKVILFVQENAITEPLRQMAKRENIELDLYENIVSRIEKMTNQETILMDIQNTNYTIYKTASKNHKIVHAENPTNMWKAIKNEVEQRNMKEVYLRDSVVVTKFIYWVKNIVKQKEITELEAASYLDHLRSQVPGFLDLSFDTISAYKENAAMMHYQATKEHTKVLHPEGTLLVDSGGQYMGGTTDVTRTIVLGAISNKEKIHFTYVCMGMLNLMYAKFLYGCTGRNLDILAREPLWRIDTDYKCGTGHGIGYILNVHEGPQSIRWRYTPKSEEIVFEEGMTVSNEPGVYIENEYGIRTENIMICKKGTKNGDGQFMHFEPLTFVPIDVEAIDTALLSETDIEKLNQYHKEVAIKISPYLNEKEAKWLKDVTRPLHHV